MFFASKVEKCPYGREYTADEIWSNYIYFIKAVLPWRLKRECDSLSIRMIRPWRG